MAKGCNVAEAVFKFNNRHNDDMFETLVKSAGGMVMCAYHITVNLPQTFKGTLTIPHMCALHKQCALAESNREIAIIQINL